MAHTATRRPRTTIRMGASSFTVRTVAGDGESFEIDLNRLPQKDGTVRHAKYAELRYTASTLSKIHGIKEPPDPVERRPKVQRDEPPEPPHKAVRRFRKTAAAHTAPPMMVM